MQGGARQAGPRQSMASADSQSEGSLPEGPRDLRKLQIRVERFEERHLPLVVTFSQRYSAFVRPSTAAFYRWLYLESQPHSRVYLALSGDECLAMVYALRKPYLIAGQAVHCLEAFDWHSLPALRGSGVGLWVLRALMRESERLITFGGSPDVLSALPALGWQNIGTTRRFELPISGESLRPGLRRRLHVALPGDRFLLSMIASWYRPKRRRVLGEVVPVSFPSSELDALYSGDTGYDFLQMPDASVLRWMTSQYPGNGSFAFLYFTVAGRIRAWALTRVYETPEGREAAIVEVFGPQPNVDLYTWIVSEAATWLAGLGPRLIRARASCPFLHDALVANRFRLASEEPIHTWPRGLPDNMRVHITLNHADEPVRPYPVPEALTGFLTI